MKKRLLVCLVLFVVGGMAFAANNYIGAKAGFDFSMVFGSKNSGGFGVPLYINGMNFFGEGDPLVGVYYRVGGRIPVKIASFGSDNADFDLMAGAGAGLKFNGFSKKDASLLAVGAGVQTTTQFSNILFLVFADWTYLTSANFGISTGIDIGFSNNSESGGISGSAYVGFSYYFGY